MSAPGNGTKLGTTYTHQLTDSTKLSVPNWERTYNALVSILLSLRISIPCQPGLIRTYIPLVTQSCRSFSGFQKAGQVYKKKSLCGDMIT